MNKVLTQIQIFLERTAYYAAYAVIVLLLLSPIEKGGFALNTSQSGTFILIMTSIIAFLPILVGRVCDMIGCRKSQLIALGLNLSGYLLFILNAHIASSTQSTFTVLVLVMISAILIGLGTGTFFPAAYGKISQSFHHKYLGIGFAIAIILANIGGLLGPLATSVPDNTPAIGIYIAIGITVINILLTATIGKSTPRSLQTEQPECTERTERRFSYKPILLFLLTITLFSIPVTLQTQFMDKYFIDWMPEANLSDFFKTDKFTYLPLYHWMNMILNAIALILIIPLTLILSRFNRRKTLLAGMGLFIVSFIPLCFARTSIFSVLAILPLLCGYYIFTIKLLEYIAVNAPANRKATYMGLYKIPIALSGLLTYAHVYNLVFAKETLAEKALLGAGIDTTTLDSEQLLHSLSTVLNLSDSEQVTDYLWELHHPWHIWLILGVIGAVSIVLVSAFLKHHNELDDPPAN